MKVLAELLNEFSIFRTSPDDDTQIDPQGQDDDFVINFSTDDITPDNQNDDPDNHDHDNGHDPETCQCPCHKHDQDIDTGLENNDNIEVIDAESTPDDETDDEEGDDNDDTDDLNLDDETSDDTNEYNFF